MYCKQVWPTSAFTVIKQNVHLSSLIVKRPDTNKVGWFFCLSCIIIMADISDPTSIRRVYLYTYGWVKTLILLLKILFKQPGINNFVSLTLEHMLRTRYDSSVQFSAQLCPTLSTLWAAARQASLSNTNSWSPPKLMSIELVMPSNHLILCRPLLLLPSIFLSIRVFSNESALRIRWPKYWSFSFNISPSNEHLGLISFRMD